MTAIGIDTHKRTLAACAGDEVGSVIDERTFACTQDGFGELAAGGVSPSGQRAYDACPRRGRRATTR